MQSDLSANVQVPSDVLMRSPDSVRNRLRAAEGAQAAERPAELKKAAQEFESIFVAYLLKVMRETIEEAEGAESGFGKSIYTDLFDQELARNMAQHGVLGISDLLMKGLTATAQSSGGAAPSSPASAQREAPGRQGPTGEEISDIQLPVKAPISSSYGVRSDPLTHQARFHKGIDLAAPAGTEVRAALAGEVVFAGYDGGFGNSVVLRHASGIETRYAHLAETSVTVGQRLEAQQILGTVGRTGRSTGPHLHFEVMRNGEPVNPAAAELSRQAAPAAQRMKQAIASVL